MSLNLRFATPSDRDDVVGFLLAAGGGIFEQMFEGAYPGLRARDALKLGASDRNSPYFLGNALLLREEGKSLGCLLSFPSESYVLPDIVRTMIPKRRLDPLSGIFDVQLPPSLYINTLAVSPEAQGRGLAGMLLSSAFEMAREDGYRALTLHAWSDNEAAQGLYAKHGFQTLDEVAVPRTDYLPHDGPMLLLRADVESS